MCGGENQREDDQDEDDGDEDEDEDDDGGEPDKRTSSKKTFTQAEVNQLVSAAVKKKIPQLERRIAKRIEDDFTAKNADKDLQKQVELYKPKAEKADEYEELLEEFYDIFEAEYEQTLSTLPDFIQEMAPDDDASPLEKKKWLVEKATPALKRYEAKRKKRGDDEEDEDGDNGDDRKKGTRGFKPNDSKTRRTRESKLEQLTVRHKGSGLYRGMGNR